MTTAATLVKEVNTLTSLPDAYFKVRKLMEEPSSSIDDFSRVIEVDTALAARVLRMANSAFFGFSAKIDNISRAVNIMGVSQLHDLILATSATSAFKGLFIGQMDMNKFWSQSIHCAVLSRLLASECGIVDSDRLFVTGLLHDIGHLLMYSRYPEECGDILRRSQTEKIHTEILERQVLGFDAAEVGAELLKIWMLPESFIQVLRKQNAPDKADKYRLDTCVVHIAKGLCLDLNESEKSESMCMALDVSGLGDEELQFIVREARLHYEDTRGLIMPNGVGKAA